MGRAIIILFLLATMLYVGAAVLYAYFFATKNRKMSIAATICTGLGFICHTIAIGLRWIEGGQPPIQGAFNSLSLVAWSIVLVYFVVEHLIRIKTLGILLLPIAAVVMAVAGLSFTAATTELAGILKSTQVLLHLVMVFTAYGAFAVAAAAGILYLLQERQLKRKQIGAFFRRLPSLDVLDELERRAVIFGVPFITVGLVLGIVRAIRYVPNWYLDPLVMLAIFTWLFYAAYLLLRHYAGWEGRRAAWLAIVGLVLISGLRLMASGNWAIFHRYGG